MRGARRQRWVRGAAVVGLAAIVSALAGPPGAPERRAEALSLTQTNELTQKRVDLASGKEFYLVLDPNAGRLQMLLKNAVLRDFKILDVEVGYPMVAYRQNLPEHEWQGEIFGGGELDPPRPLDRLVVVAPPPSPEEKETPQLPVPPTPEEKYPVPSRYHVRFESGVSIEVRTGEADPSLGFWERTKRGLAHWWRDVRAAVTGQPADTVRLRLVLRPEDARSLYRALPPATKLLVIPRA